MLLSGTLKPFPLQGLKKIDFDLPILYESLLALNQLPSLFSSELANEIMSIYFWQL